ncbi:hypothetical protein GSI_09772 [Ganoderma sinense ZZ0214-1]|uniref:Peptidase A1 domain-containing protein n=1 Tax=Ganoderma sinense ZZ0214-1 TaxID=1077348 RepID=A0A2G8S2Y9_9APHY|nr:hypothetical protein GSI_09772 [Ganoderma sinense ZZ0214-1]
MFLRGLVDISTISDDDATSSTCSDSKESGTGIDIQAAENEVGLHSQRKRITLTEDDAKRVGEQRFRVFVEISSQHVADIGNLRKYYSEYIRGAGYLLDLDNGSNTTFASLIEYRKKSGFADASHGPPCSVHGPLSIARDERAKIFDHAYVHRDSFFDPEDPTTRGLVKFGDESGAAVLMHDQELRLSIPCFDRVENRWNCGRLLLDYKPGVACAATKGIYSRRVSGVLALGPMRHQSAFDNAVDRHSEVPSFLEALKPCLPPLPEGGTVVYLAIRPMALYKNTETGYRLLERNAEHWMALNGWPCELQADWSPPIYLVPEALGGERHWKVRLLSMTFQHYDVDTQKCRDLDDLDARTITFGDGGLVVHLDCGTSVSFVPPALVRHIRTKLWPTAKNKEIDATQQDSPCDLHSDSKPQLAFYVPDNECMSISYTFADGRGGKVQATGPSSHFFGEPNPFRANRSRTKDGEGMVFVGPPEVIGAGDSEAIFGLNFFQSMYVALHNPDDGAAYVRLAPQWDAQRHLFSPVKPQSDDDGPW